MRIVALASIVVLSGCVAAPALMTSYQPAARPMGVQTASVNPLDPTEDVRHTHDDGECRSYGYKFGTPEYAGCRERLEGYRLQRPSR